MPQSSPGAVQDAPNLLVVEDESVVAMDIGGQLREMGYRVCGWVDNFKTWARDLRKRGLQPTVLPARSSVARAFALLGRSWDDVAAFEASAGSPTASRATAKKPRAAHETRRMRLSRRRCSFSRYVRRFSTDGSHRYDA